MSEPLYHDGYSEAVRKALDAPLEELLKICDGLRGRDEIEDATNVEEVREIALAQLAQEYRNPNHPDWNTVETYSKVHSLKSGF